MRNKKSEKGAALLTTIILGVVALAVVAALMTFIMYGKRTSVIETRYTSALEAAKGGADIIIGGLINDTLYCHCGSSKQLCSYCIDGNVDYDIYIGQNANSTQMTIGNYTVTAKIISKITTSSTEIYAVKVDSVSSGSNPERATVEFVIKVE
ncbi:hypothetical protein [Persephonella sp.]|uniref:hypothetical protein n=1 Tax=Persephonella sp. TaxID=2060922 RepID=UPI0026137221|nr:hypothetical protein [Persephonella sp.]